MIGCARTVEKNKLMYGKPEFTGKGGIVADPSYCLLRLVSRIPV